MQRSWHMTFKPRDKLILAPHNEQKKKVFGAKIQTMFKQHMVNQPKWKTHLLRIQNKLKIAKKNLYSNLLVGRTITSTIKREKWFCGFALLQSAALSKNGGINDNIMAHG